PAVSPLPPHLVAERADRSAQTVRRQPCPRCGADTLTARTPDRVAALAVRTDPPPIDPATIPADPPRLRWRPTRGPHPPHPTPWPPCPRCGADTLPARTPARVAALDVRTAPQPIDPATIPADRTRLVWCLTGGAHTPQRIRWRDRWHAPHCTHPVLITHRCPPQPVQGVLL